MALRLRYTLLLLVLPLRAQLPLGNRQIIHYEAHAESRWTALARLGAMTNISLLVEPGDMAFLNTPIDLVLNDTTADKVIAQIFHGRVPYTTRQRGALLILSTPSAPNRIATMQLGPITFQEKSLSALIPSLGFRISAASGCAPIGYLYGGPLLELDIPPFQLAHATLEQVAARVALAPEPTFWVIPSLPRKAGCIEEPAAHWMVGLYGFGRGFTDCNTAFRGTIGADVTAVNRRARAPDTTCHDAQVTLQ